jgi:glycosyltransferase involved in cell wall biosynthesis
MPDGRALEACMPQPRVSVIVPTFNRSQYIAECLDSLLAQTLAPWQVIVVDDGCTDDTAQVLAPYADRITRLRTPRQSGKPGAANVGLAHATGDYVWLFDDDDVALPDALARFVAPLERDPSLGFSYSAWAYADSGPDGRIGAPTWETPDPDPDIARRGALPALLKRNYLGGAALFLRMSAQRALGPYDETLTRAQDHDMAIRAVRRFRGAQAPGGATFVYRQHAGARGSARDRFAATSQFAKWLEYDRIIIRRLRRDLRPGELLPPHRERATSARLEQLEYFALVAGRILPADATRELRLLAMQHDDRPLDADERLCIRETAMRDPWYAMGSVWDDPAFAASFATLAAQYPLVRAVRREVLWGLRHFVTMHGAAAMPSRLPIAARRARALFQQAPARGYMEVPQTPMPGPRV